jgi:alpha/beta superfamily hydrolase
VRAALDWLAAEFKLPILFTGFSFGAATGLRAACPHASVDAIISLGTPAQVDGRQYGYDFLRSCSKPKLFVSGSEDEFATQAQLRKLVDAVPLPKQLVLIAGGDHFFAGHLPDLQSAITAWVREQKLV